ncbi:MAG: four helix bundle protein [Candidatus Levybacteria bacterium]|nr:four helix bundle protein [Candidatus Levybacteria bacterium]
MSYPERISKFTDLNAWQEAHKLTLIIYSHTNLFPKNELFGLTSQIRRAVVSIESCIAEGFSRYHYKDRLTFYFDSRGSLAEVESQSITARDLKYITNENYKQIIDQAEKVSIILGGLIRKTQSLSEVKM